METPTGDVTVNAGVIPSHRAGGDSILRVGGSTPPQELAAAIAHACYEGNPPTLRAIGAGAVNQAIKACAVARQYVGPRAMDLTIRPGFTTLPMRDGEEISAILLKVVLD